MIHFAILKSNYDRYILKLFYRTEYQKYEHSPVLIDKSVNIITMMRELVDQETNYKRIELE